MKLFKKTLAIAAITLIGTAAQAQGFMIKQDCTDQDVCIKVQPTSGITGPVQLNYEIDADVVFTTFSDTWTDTFNDANDYDLYARPLEDLQYVTVLTFKLLSGVVNGETKTANASCTIPYDMGMLDHHAVYNIGVSFDGTSFSCSH